MSGGVDSAVTAALLLERGHRVRGVTARFWREGGEADQDMASARAVCRRLGIDHEVVDLADEFYRAVVQHFVAEYAAGRTPTPASPATASSSSGCCSTAWSHGASAWPPATMPAS